MMTNEYRDKLIFKLRALIAVLKVAIAKIQTASRQPSADIAKLDKIMNNLESTLKICNRALASLENTSKSTLASGTEISTIDEYNKFKTMQPITPSEIQSTDLDDLVKKLQS